jgi:Male sterility protein
VRGEPGRRRLREGVGPEIAGRLELVDGDVTRPFAGVPVERHAALRGAFDQVVHLAALVRLDDAAEAELTRTNVDGTRHILQLVERLGGPRLAYVSSCSVGGNAAAFSEHDREAGQTLRNVYERTKLAGEKLVADGPRGHLIMRVPGVVGDSRTGACRFFAGTFYRVLAAYFLLREDLEVEWRGAGRPALEVEGIRFAVDGTLHLPFHLPFSAESDCAVVPQDWLATTVVDLVEHADARGTFHLVHPRPPKVGRVLPFGLARLHVAAPVPGSLPTRPAGPWARFVRRSLERVVRYQLPYLRSVPRLASERLPALLGRAYVPPPDLSEPRLRRLIDFAKVARFGEAAGQPSPAFE